MRIGLDPGHGGNDSGAVGRKTGLREDDVALDIALSLRAMLQAAGHVVIMTRNVDVFVPLDERSRIFNEARVDIAVSIHVNASTAAAADYISTWLYDMDGESEELAKLVQRRLVNATGWPDGSVREKNLHMVREVKAKAAILVELGFISNAAEESKLGTPAFRKLLAAALCDGINVYAAANQPAAVKITGVLSPITVKTENGNMAGYLINGRSYAPVKDLAAALGHQVEWDQAAQTVTVK